MKLEERLSKLKSKIESELSSEQIQVMHKATQDLIDSGIQDKVLKVGDQLPEFDLVDQDSYEISAAELVQSGRTLITFYRGVWCPYCNIDLTYLQKVYPEIQDSGSELICISPNLPIYSRETIEKHDLTFPIYTDRGNKVAEKFGLVFTVPEALKEMYIHLWNINLEEYNGDDSWTLPVPSRFLVDVDGFILYAESSPDYTMRPDPEEVLFILHTI